MRAVDTPGAATFQHFRSQGYVRLDSIIPPALVAHLRAWVIERVDDHHKLYGLYERDPLLFRQIFEVPLLRATLELLLGPHVVLVLNRHNVTALSPRSMQNGRLHRDILQWTRGLLTLVVYLDDADTDNGCTHVIPGSHLAVTVGAPQAEGGGTWLDEHEEFRALEGQALPVPISAGGVLLLDSMLFHSSGPSRLPDRERVALIFGVRSADELAKGPNAKTVRLYGDALYRGNDSSNYL